MPIPKTTHFYGKLASRSANTIVSELVVYGNYELRTFADGQPITTYIQLIDRFKFVHERPEFFFFSS